MCQEKIQKGLRPLLQILHIFLASNFRLEPKHGSIKRLNRIYQNIISSHISKWSCLALHHGALSPVSSPEHGEESLSSFISSSWQGHSAAIEIPSSGESHKTKQPENEDVVWCVLVSSQLKPLLLFTKPWTLTCIARAMPTTWHWSNWKLCFTAARSSSMAFVGDNSLRILQAPKNRTWYLWECEVSYWALPCWICNVGVQTARVKTKGCNSRSKNFLGPSFRMNQPAQLVEPVHLPAKHVNQEKQPLNLMPTTWSNSTLKYVFPRSCKQRSESVSV